MDNARLDQEQKKKKKKLISTVALSKVPPALFIQFFSFYPLTCIDNCGLTRSDVPSPQDKPPRVLSTARRLKSG